MTPGDATLPDDLDTAHRQIREQAEALRQQAHLIARLQHQLERLLRQRYGKKGEKVDPDQLLLFAQDILARAEPMAAGTSAARIGRDEAQAQGHGRKPLPASLPRKRIVHDVAPEDRACPECGGELADRRGGPRAARIRARQPDRARARPPEVCRAGCAAHVVIAAR